MSIDHRPLTEFDYKLIGGDIRITIPLKDRYPLREIANCMRRLATELEFSSKSESMTHVDALNHARRQARVFRLSVQSICLKYGIDVKEGRPTNAARERAKYNKEKYAQRANNVATLKTVS